MSTSQKQPLMTPAPPNSWISSKLLWSKPVFLKLFNCLGFVVSCTTQFINFSTVDSCATQLVNGDGAFNSTGLDNFVKTTDMANTDLDYTVVSIIGPQSSGKSTLMNLLFGTAFKEMNAFKGRTQTTKGIWIGKTGMQSCTIALDIEGTDGRERGEDDTTFEKQSALFALAVSNVVLINLWCHDIGRDQAASKPLLRIIFQVMLRILSPRKITLMFVLRDKTKTPLKKLESDLKEDIQKIWDAIPKPPAHVHAPLSDFFKVKVTALSNYEDDDEVKKKKFMEEVYELRNLIYHSIPPRGLAGDRRDAVPASAFHISAKHIWELIRDNKDLDVPAHEVLVATVRCEDIAKENLAHLRSNKAWLELNKAAQSNSVQGFGEKSSYIIDTYRSRYDEETKFFDEDVRNAKGKQFESDLLNEMSDAYKTIIGHLRSKALTGFMTNLAQAIDNGEEFDSSVHNCTLSIMDEFEKGSADAAVRQAKWDISKVQEELQNDINSHALHVRKSPCKIQKEDKKRDLALAAKIVIDCVKVVTFGLVRLDVSKLTENYQSLLSGVNHVCQFFKKQPS